ncbi:ATP-dependent Clp protease adapter protein ClpS1, chloroplastic-like protein [Tanacetum coccineum]
MDKLINLTDRKDIGRVRDKKTTSSGDSYKVLLIDDARHTKKLVVKALPQAVPAVTPDDASKLFHVSRENGLAVVLVTVSACFLFPVIIYAPALEVAFFTQL